MKQSNFTSFWDGGTPIPWESEGSMAKLTHTSVVIEQYPLSSAAAVDCAIWSKETQVTTATIQNPAWR